jgi:hypothetical protein
MSSSHAASRVNVTGFVAGTVLFAMLLTMVIRPRANQEGRSGIDLLLVVTALLGLAWNLEAFVSSGLRDFGVAPLPRFAQAIAYASLGFLPAVVVHSVLRAGLSRLTSPATRSDGEMSTLGAELSLVMAYLDIEKARFEDRLTVEIDVPATLHAAVIPPLLIQPLVENAIKHGIAPFRRRGRLDLGARLDDAPDTGSTLVVTITDSGPGLHDVEGAMHDRPGVGLRNIEDRLARVYGAAGGLRLTSTPDHGTTAELHMPFTRSLPHEVPANARLSHR